MSLSIAGIGASLPVYAPSGPVVPYAQNQVATESVASTTAGAETGAASVVYEPGASDTDQQLTYSRRDSATKAAALAAAVAASAAPGIVGDAAVVQATGGAAPPPHLFDAPRSPEPKEISGTAETRPVMADPVAGAGLAGTAQVQANQAEASAQASYAAVVDAMIAGAPLSDLHKFA